MNIIEMNATFGKLENSNLQLGKHLNILEGPNEAGKSTWCAFIRAMLYGIDTSERDTKFTLAVKNKYLPRTGSPMGGTMLLDCHLGQLTLERKTRSTGPMREFQALNSTGHIDQLTESTAGNTILGIGLETFERSAFIDNPQLPSGSGGELERRILSLVTSGEETASYSEAANTLHSLQRKLKYRNHGEIPEIEDKIYSLKLQSESISDKVSVLSEKLSEIRALEQKKQTLLKDIEADNAEDKRAAASRLLEAESNYSKALSILHQAEENLLPGRPTSQELRQIEKEAAQDAENERTLNLRTEQLSQTKKGLQQQEAKLKNHRVISSKKKLSSSIIPISIISLPILLALFLLMPHKYAIPSSAAYIVAIVLLIVYLSKTKAKAFTAAEAKIIQEIELLKAEYSSNKSEIDNTPVLSEETIHRIFEIFPLLKSRDTVHPEIQELIAQGIDSNHRYEVAASKLTASKDILEVLRTSTTGTTDRTSKTELNQVETALTSLRRETALIEGSLEHTKSPAEQNSEISLLSEKLDILNHHYDAITIALETLDKANKMMRERFSPALNRAAASIFSSFTGNKYSDVVITREFDAMAGQGDSDGLRRAYELSQGTADQLYIALRLAICQVVHPPSFNIPIILDDALISFDDTRLAYALEWLYKLSKTRQILLFTCTSRERLYLSQRPGINIIKLDQLAHSCD